MKETHLRINNKSSRTQQRPNSTKTLRKQSFPLLLVTNNSTHKQPHYDLSLSSTRPYHDPNATYIPKP